MTTNWKTYEDVARHLIDQAKEHFGLERVEGKQKIRGLRSGTHWEIDAKGIREGDQGIIIIECRRYPTSSIKQEDLGGLAYRIIDSGAVGGIIVSPLIIQKGAQKIAEAENVVQVLLDENSTPTDFTMQFFNKLMVGVGISMGVVLGVSASAEVRRICKKCKERFTVTNNERTCPDCRVG